VEAKQMCYQRKNELKYKDKNGEEIWGIKDLNTLLRRNNQLLKKYYNLAIIFGSLFFMVILYIIVMLHKYHFITLLIQAMGGI